MKRLRIPFSRVILAGAICAASLPAFAGESDPSFTYDEDRGTFMVQYVPDGRTVKTAPIYCRFYIGDMVWWDHARRNHRKYPLPFDWTQEYSNHMCKLIAVWKNIHK